MTPILRRYTYVLRKERRSLVKLRINYNGKRVSVPTGIHVDPEKWEGSRCRRNTTHGETRLPASYLNSILDDLERRLDGIFLVFEMKDEMPSPEDLRMALRPRKGKNEPVGFFEAYDLFLKEGSELLQWSENTRKKLSTFKKLLMKFDPKLTFEDMTTEKMKRLMAFQTKNAVAEESLKELKTGKAVRKYKGKYQNDTINRNIKYLKWFLRWAREKKLHDNTDFEEFKIRYKTTKRPVIFLTWQELMAMFNLELPYREELEKTRDMFCFCCFTSLRYSDLANLRWCDVYDDAIHVTTIKTTDSIIIDLNRYSSAILEKYRAKDKKQQDKVFPIKSSQQMNNGLKELGKLAGINSTVHLIEMYGSSRQDIAVPKYELLSTHCGRRTFICNALSMGIPPNVVMKWTGHSDYKAMQPYIDISDENRKNSMDKFNR